MKLKFKNQDFQNEAVKSVTDLFKGQERTSATFSIAENTAQYNMLQNDFGFGNNLLLDEKTLADNLHAVQKRHRLPMTDETALPLHVSVEMETGTGKTYVYSKTILELNKLSCTEQELVRCYIIFRGNIKRFPKRSNIHLI